MMNRAGTGNSGKRAFTLIEMVLAMAITLIFVGLIFSTFYIVNSSHARVAVMNDARDFASLNMTAIENLTVNSDLIIISDSPVFSYDSDEYISIYYDNTGSGILYFAKAASSSPAFAYDQYKLSNGKVKWSVDASFEKDSKQSVLVTLDIIDNATGNVYYTLTKTLFLPNVTKGEGISCEPTTLTSGKYLNYHTAAFIATPTP